MTFEVCIVCSVFIPADSSKHQYHSQPSLWWWTQPLSKMMSAVRSEILPLAYARCFSNWYKSLIQRVQSDFFQDIHSYFPHVSLYDLPPVFSDLPHSLKVGWPVWLSSLFEYLVSCIFKVKLPMNGSALSKLEYFHKSHPKFSSHRDKKKKMKKIKDAWG